MNAHYNFHFVYPLCCAIKIHPWKIFRLQYNQNDTHDIYPIHSFIKINNTNINNNDNASVVYYTTD